MTKERHFRLFIGICNARGLHLGKLQRQDPGRGVLPTAQPDMQVFDSPMFALVVADQPPRTGIFASQISVGD